MKLWAHRGCSQRYPENTMTAFEKANEIEGLVGVELDIQLTKDGEIVVYHDERIERNTGGIGFLKDYTLAELKKININMGEYYEKIPTMEEVFDLFLPRMKSGFLLNIELKNYIYPYENMENKILELAHKKGIQNQVIYSTFYAKSLSKIKELDQNANLAILDWNVSDCKYKLRGGCGAAALHPYWKNMDLSKDELEGYVVRAWMTGHLYPEKPTGTLLDMQSLESYGITDLILNEPEIYL